MKSISLAFVASLLTFVFTLGAQAQNTLQLQLQHLINGEALELETNHSIFGTNLAIDRLEYYLSDFVITHDGGQTTELTDTYILVNVDDDEPMYSLGDWDINNVEAIDFSVGVDEEHNHLDPATYASGHPLAPQYPSMHWGWASGYRFVALEGLAGSTLNAVFEVHALGDNNFFNQSHEFAASAVDGNVTISLHANYENLFIQLNVANGLIEHSTTNEAVTVLENMRDEVFAPGTSAVGLSDLLDAPEWCRAYPNPSSDWMQLIWSNDVMGSTFDITDTQGRVVHSANIQSPVDILDVQGWAPGIYFIQSPIERVAKRLIIQ